MHQSPRKSLSLRYLQRKRALLATELGDSVEAVFDYGDHDPLSVPSATCDACGGAPALRRVQTEPSRWQIWCGGCDKHHREAHKRPWLAILAWNQINLGTQDYHQFPLFGIASLTREQAGARMLVVRRELELRSKLAGLNRRVGGQLQRPAPGSQYRLRLEAYLAWALLAQRLLKFAARRV